MSGPILRKQKLELFGLGFYLVDSRLDLLRSDTWHRQFEGLLVGGGEVSLFGYGSRHVLLNP